MDGWIWKQWLGFLLNSLMSLLQLEQLATAAGITEAEVAECSATLPLLGLNCVGVCFYKLRCHDDPVEYMLWARVSVEIVAVTVVAIARGANVVCYSFMELEVWKLT